MRDPGSRQLRTPRVQLDLPSQQAPGPAVERIDLRGWRQADILAATAATSERMELGAMPYILRQVRLRFAERANRPSRAMCSRSSSRAPATQASWSAAAIGSAIVRLACFRPSPEQCDALRRHRSNRLNSEIADQQAWLKHRTTSPSPVPTA